MATVVIPRPAAGFRPWVVDWLTTVDHKKLGIMYIYTSMVFFLAGGIFALLVRTQLIVANNDFLSHARYNEFMTLHGSIMVFLFVIPIWAGFGNYLVPLQIGAPDMAFPRVNALSFWLFPLGGALIMGSLFVPEGPPQVGWTAYSPLSETMGPGMDLWLVGVFIVGVSSTIGAANFITTCFRMRAPGMGLFRMPVFTWNVLATSAIQLLATPVLASALAMLYISRNFGGNTFDAEGGGNPILWQNVFWFYSHPAVYIMILPGMGIVSEVIPVFARKPLFGYKAFVFATLGIAALGFTVWAHHMFATGAVLKPFFGFMSFLIGIPTGIKFFNWLATLWRGSIIFPTAMLFSLGFIANFLIGGITGIYVAAVPIDFAAHDTYFVVGHIHYVLFGGSVMALFSGIYYWFPKIWGRRLDEKLGQANFWLVFVGMELTFMPMHILGLDGMPRRIATYNQSDWEPMNFISTIGSYTILAGMLLFVVNVVMTFATKPKHEENDPWDGATLEWWTTSPPPAHNFDSLPEVRSERPVFDAKYGVAGVRPAEEVMQQP